MFATRAVAHDPHSSRRRVARASVGVRHTSHKRRRASSMWCVVRMYNARVYELYKGLVSSCLGVFARLMVDMSPTAGLTLSCAVRRSYVLFCMAGE